ncbi:carbon monoxide dehydrogenase subunit G [Kitasatospora sp. MAP12-15]|uniref:hypothetical protein n=1 Tax=unclassified Kitasatospora TaxID=2633591 RepID=UPI002476BABF|nr:hypothetical protein [Kitasatospora sp. MAP12-44]MDH6115288.1 carbon monoxide dehydrogenase subunit G [Kitasatospora sp. MAP12-44]
MTPPPDRSGGGVTFTEVDGGTAVRWTTRAEISVPLLGALLTRHFARPVITRTFRAILAAADTALTR